MATRQIKMTIVGEKGCGKTAFILKMVSSTFPEEHIPTVFDNYNVIKDIRPNLRIDFGIWDTAGSEDYDRLRPLSYPLTDVFIVCFDVSSRKSFVQASEKFSKEIQHHCPNIPAILCALKVDLREKHAGTISSEEGYQLAKELKCAGYYECSALRDLNLNPIFDMAARITVEPKLVIVQGVPWPIISEPSLPPVARGFDSLDADLTKLLENRILCDVVFRGNRSGETIEAHRIVLAATCPQFSNLLGCSISVESSSTINHDLFQNQRESVTDDGKKVLEFDLDEEQLSLDNFRLLVQALYNLMNENQAISSFKDVDTRQLTLIKELLKGVTPARFLAFMRQELCPWQLQRCRMLDAQIQCDSDNPIRRLQPRYPGRVCPFSDISLNVGNTQFQAHRSILLSRSPYFEAILSDNFIEKSASVIEVEVDGSAPEEVFAAFLEFLYTGDIVGIQDNPHLLELIVLADRLNTGKRSLVPLCEWAIAEQLRSTYGADQGRPQQLPAESDGTEIIQIFQCAHQFHAGQLAAFCKVLIGRYYDTLKRTEEWASLDPAAIEELESEPEWYRVAKQEYQQALKNPRQAKLKRRCFLM